MKILTLLVGNAVAWCLLFQPALSQEAGSAAATGSPSGTSSPAGANPASSAGPAAGNNTSVSPATDGTSGVANSPNSSPTAAGTQPLSGAQPGQTGSMESQRLNALNQEYHNQQQRELTRDQQQGEQQNALNGANQLDPSRGVGRGPAFQGDPALGERGVNQLAPGQQVAPAYRGLRLRGNQPFDRGLVIEGLRQLGQPGDDWRVVNHGGRWWYYTPDKAWMYYGDEGWVSHRAGNFRREGVDNRRDVSFPGGYPTDDWRLVFHGGRWWFWTPNQTWMYHRDGRWNDFRSRGPIAGRTQSNERYGVGYRGPDTAIDPRSTTDVPPASEDRMGSQQRLQADPTLDPVNNPRMPSQMTPDRTTNPTKTQDETGIHIDAQN